MKDLTKGNIANDIIKFAIPIFFTNLLQLGYSFIDMRMVGEVLGETALAAVGAAAPLNTLIIGLLIGMSNGFAVIVSRYFGAKDNKRLKNTVAASYILGIAISFILTVTSLALLRPILKLLNTPDDIMGEAYSYIWVILAGMAVTMMYNICSSLLRAIGDTVTPLIFLAVSAVLNIAGDYMCMAVLGMGVAGAAIATVAAQTAAAVACAIYSFRRYDVLRLGVSDCRIRKETAVKLLSSGLSMGVMNSIVSLGTVSLQSAINTFGTHTIAAHSAARKITELFMMLFGVFGMTMATFCGQNMGAGQMKRIKDGIRISIFITWIWCTGTIVAAWTAGPSLIRLVTGSNEAEVLATGALYLRINTLFYYVPAVIAIVRNAMQGIGDHITPIISSSVELIGKVLIVIILVPQLKYTAIIISEPIVWILMVIPLLVRIKFT